jgi:hypothetical protein
MKKYSFFREALENLKKLKNTINFWKIVEIVKNAQKTSKKRKLHETRLQFVWYNECSFRPTFDRQYRTLKVKNLVKIKSLFLKNW